MQALNPGRPIGTSTVVSATQVVTFLENTAGEIDGILRARGYGIPVSTTATSALRDLQYGNTLGAAALVEQAAQSSDRRDQAWKMWQSWKGALERGDVVLDDAVDVARAVPRYSANATPVFFMGMDT